jgi:UDP-N-acetylmuramoyl-L-alanyl-D-glutamate--2,6-diaminopimelate ligase
MRKVNLNQLVSHFPKTFQGPAPDVPVTGIALDSRLVEPGNVFVALEGGSVDGHRYIPEAITQGAAAVVGTKPALDIEVPYLEVPDGRLALAQLSAAYFGFPARELIVIGVTGTDGKTTTANLIFHILRTAGIQVGMISTVNAQIGEKVLDTGFHVTTPEAPLVQGYLAEMVAAGMTHVILETTSHGLEQKRVACCEFDLGVVTNITHEHLDYHGSYADYLAAKGSLLTELAKSVIKKRAIPRLAVLNRDDSSYKYLEELVEGLAPSVDRVTYGIGPGAEVSAANVQVQPRGLRFSTKIRQSQSIEIKSTLVGAYNVSNCMAAISTAAVGLGIDGKHIQQGIAEMPGIPGRMEAIDLGQDFLALVDFAHTPNALEKVLQSARELTDGRVIAVFGSAGLRDQAKRGLMAEISARLADLTVLTAEDPRSESLSDILSDMATSMVKQGGEEGRTFWRVPDRGNAIRFGLTLAKPDDLVISCGKGHEQSMCFGTIEYAWDDRTAMRAALAEHLGIDGPQMPYLPTQE